MKKRKKRQKDWVDHLRSHHRNCNLPWKALQKLGRESQNGTDIRRLLYPLKQRIRQIQQEAGRLYEEMVSTAVGEMFCGSYQNVTEQQYWLVRAAGLEHITAKRLGIFPFSDYEVYRNCIYQEGKITFLMNPNETPWIFSMHKKTGCLQIRSRTGRSPEETRLPCYRPEQKQFFARFRPDVLRRAKPN